MREADLNRLCMPIQWTFQEGTHGINVGALDHKSAYSEHILQTWMPSTMITKTSQDSLNEKFLRQNIATPEHVCLRAETAKWPSLLGNLRGYISM